MVPVGIDIPVGHGLLRRESTELAKRGGGQKSRRVPAIPAVRVDGAKARVSHVIKDLLVEFFEIGRIEIERAHLDIFERVFIPLEGAAANAFRGAGEILRVKIHGSGEAFFAEILETFIGQRIHV